MKKFHSKDTLNTNPRARGKMDQLAHVLSLVSAHRASLCSVKERRDSRDVEMRHNRSRGSDKLNKKSRGRIPDHWLTIGKP